VNEVLSRIATLQARFAPPVTSVAATTRARTSAANGNDFATVLRSARDAASTRDAAPGTPPAARADQQAAISRIAAEEGVPASLLDALVWSESSYNPDAVSPAGARGLAQLMPATAASLGVDIDNPTDNLRGGARYLRQMLDRFGRVDLALAAYNAGPTAVARAGGIPPYPETQQYVAKVLARADHLERSA
jgi:soluble lytic murein transglycosylase-like protein